MEMTLEQVAKIAYEAERELGRLMRADCPCYDQASSKAKQTALNKVSAIVMGTDDEMLITTIFRCTVRGVLAACGIDEGNKDASSSTNADDRP